jgi:hypothetical protein
MYGTAVVGWQKRFSRATSGSLAAGLAATASRLTSDVDYVTNAYPYAAVSFEYLLGQPNRLTLRVDAQTSPTVDSRTGALTYSAAVTSSLHMTFRGGATTAIAAGVLQTIASSVERPSTSAFGTLTTGYPIGKRVTIDASASAAWQDQLGVGSAATYTVFVGATVRALPLRF